MDQSENSPTYGQSTDATKPEEIPDSFVCCVCLELLHKPIALPCGHVSCFWCVHKSMNSRSASHCPICRHPYGHFPAVCQLLHSLLLKMYPVAYKKREELISEEEKQNDVFSPQLDDLPCKSHADRKPESANSSTDIPLVNQGELCNGRGQPEYQSDDRTVNKQDRVADGFKCITSKEAKQVSMNDLLCAACEQLLFRPVVLNCGHVYCEACVINQVDEMLRCKVCESFHPRGIPKVCLELDHFLESNFPKQYASRKAAVKNMQILPKHASAGPSTTGGEDPSSFVSEKSGSHLPCSEVHFGVGCDSCGIYPIIGDRYRCKNCMEAIGFDLCGDCYNTRSKLPGRFNQQHRPEHTLELIKPDIIHNIMVRLVSGQLENAPAAILIPGIAADNAAFLVPANVIENFEHGPESPTWPVDSQENAQGGLGAPNPDDEDMNDQHEDPIN